MCTNVVCNDQKKWLCIIIHVVSKEDNGLNKVETKKTTNQKQQHLNDWLLICKKILPNKVNSQYHPNYKMLMAPS